MFEYQNEHYENRNQMYNYNGMPENGPAEPHKLSASPNPGHTGKKARILKKAGAITLSAILFGGVAAGSFQAVNYLTGYQTPAAESAAASAGNNTSADCLSSGYSRRKGQPGCFRHCTSRNALHCIHYK